MLFTRQRPIEESKPLSEMISEIRPPPGNFGGAVTNSKVEIPPPIGLYDPESNKRTRSRMGWSSNKVKRPRVVQKREWHTSGPFLHVNPLAQLPPGSFAAQTPAAWPDLPPPPGSFGKTSPTICQSLSKKRVLLEGEMLVAPPGNFGSRLRPKKDELLSRNTNETHIEKATVISGHVLASKVANSSVSKLQLAATGKQKQQPFDNKERSSGMVHKPPTKPQNLERPDSEPIVSKEACPKCKKEVKKKTDIFCRLCGFSIKCGNCGTRILKRFCSQCGWKKPEGNSSS